MKLIIWMELQMGLSWMILSITKLLKEPLSPDDLGIRQCEGDRKRLGDI